MSTGTEATEARRVCLLTGAGGLLGAEFCRRYAADYEIVAVAGRRAPDVPSQVESYVDPLDPAADVNPARIYVLHADLTEAGAVERIVDLVQARYGYVDLLVNNAAVTRFHTTGTADGEAALTDFERYFRLNVEVPMRFAVRLAQRLWTHDAPANRRRNRNVVNVSSLSGSRVYPGGQTLYAATKAALNHLTRHQAQEFDAFGVRVNALAPDSFPHRISTASVAAAVVRLDAADVTGRILALEGTAGTDNPVTATGQEHTHG